ncbi:cache domain-containing protein [bacterium]|nr:cache domain-containing protein [bacterium]
MKISLRNKVIASLSLIVVITGLFATWTGMHLIGKSIINQAQDKVRMDLNSAREIYRENSEKIKDIIRLTALRVFLKEGLSRNNLEQIKVELDKVKKNESIDILTLTDENGFVSYRTRNPDRFGDNQAGDEIIKRVLSTKEVVLSTQIVPRNELMKEDESLAEQVRMEFIPTPRAKPREENEETSGMMIKAAAPVLDDTGRLIGILYGGTLLNRNYSIVDKIKDTVYQGQTYKGKDMGTATIFQQDLRISTNVMREDGNRAIGTRVSEEVYDQVLVKGLPWIERAFVVNNWYITAYEPIRNISGEIIGILYVGILEEKFVDMRRETMWMFIGITLAGVVVAFIGSTLLAVHILKPIKHLVFASHQLAEGNLTHKVPIESQDEIGELAMTFNFMVDSLKNRDEQLKTYTQQKIMESERLATIGQLAAGVAHELNNPLGGILVYSHLLLEKMESDDPKKEQLEKIVTQATRCKDIVKGLLDFSRQTEPKLDLTNVNELLQSTLSLVENQSLFQNIRIVKKFHPNLPKTMLDKAQIQQVFINIILNAAESMGEKGKLTITTKVSKDGQLIEIEFTDTGCGIPEAYLKKLFEPFFTTKEVGRGTGLGLAISYGIIQKHNGTIEVKSQADKGTTFTVKMPITAEKNK